MLETPGNGGTGGPPEWSAPPQMIGGHVTGPVVIGRSDGLVVAVRQVLAYPAGLEVEVEAHARGSSPEGSQPRFRLRLADGSDVPLDDGTGPDSGHGPTMVVSRSESSSGGPDDGEDVRLTLWICPLPPPGPVTLSCSWPRRGLRDAGLVLDADAVRTAALRARPFWPAGSSD